MEVEVVVKRATGERETHKVIVPADYADAIEFCTLYRGDMIETVAGIPAHLLVDIRTNRFTLPIEPDTSA